jgi:hypothetical protein
MVTEKEQNELLDLAHAYFNAPENKSTIEQELKRTIQKILPDSILESERKETTESVWKAILSIVGEITLQEDSLLPCQPKGAALGKLIALIWNNRNLTFEQSLRRPSKGGQLKKEKHGAAIKDQAPRSLVGGKSPHRVIDDVVERGRRNLSGHEDLQQRIISAGELFTSESQILALQCVQDARKLLASLEQDLKYKYEIIDTHGGWPPYSKEPFVSIIQDYVRSGLTKFRACTKIAEVLYAANIVPVSIPEDQEFGNDEMRKAYIVDKLARQICQSIKGIKLIEISRGRRYTLSANLRPREDEPSEPGTSSPDLISD